MKLLVVVLAFMSMLFVNVRAEETGEIERFFGIINANSVNIRQTPDVDSDDNIIFQANRGQSLEILDFAGDFFSINIGVFENVFVFREFVDIILDTIDEEPQGSSVYGVEWVSWWYARNHIIRTRVPLLITDVGTGITFWMESFSNGSHADVVTLTRDDTEALRRAFGGRWTWDTRAILVTVDGRTFIASISGMPHGGNGGNYVNGVNGQFCIHFPESRTHNGNRRHERDHQNSILEAFNSFR
ncbi:MAG: hypothetical protein FWG65_06860 [Turicibacter sp.]|nr:hypothetical protein [Turicibacter sp.]